MQTRKQKRTQHVQRQHTGTSREVRRCPLGRIRVLHSTPMRIQ